jgi:cytochrome c-type biogenesis protein CcmH/NrfG
MYDEAEAQFRALIDMRYQVARGHLGLGRVAEARGDRRAAAAAYRRALQLDPGLSEAKKALAALGSK